MPCALARRATPATALPARVCVVERALAGDDEVGAGAGSAASRPTRSSTTSTPERRSAPSTASRANPTPPAAPAPGCWDKIDQLVESGPRGRRAGLAVDRPRRPSGSGLPRGRRRRRGWRPSAGRTPPRRRSGRAAGCRRRPRAPGGWSPGAGRARTGRAGRGRPARPAVGQVVAVGVEQPGPRAASSPAPPSVLADPPTPTTTSSAPRSSAAAHRLTEPRLDAVSGAGTPPGSRPSPQASAISTRTVTRRPPRRRTASVADTGSPVGPCTATGTPLHPAASAAATVPSPPSATGTTTTDAGGATSSSPRRTASATSSEVERALEGVARDDDRGRRLLTHEPDRSEVPVHDVQPDPAVRPRRRRPRATVPTTSNPRSRHKRTAASVGLDHGVELHCGVTLFARPAPGPTHPAPARPRARGPLGDHEGCRRHVAAARRPVGAGLRRPEHGPSSETATTVTPGGDSTHSSCASDELSPSGYA